MRGLAKVALWASLLAASVAVPTMAEAAPGRRKVPELGELVERVRESEASVVAAERAAAKEDTKSEAQLAKRLVEGQLKLSERDYEGAAIVFLDLIENNPNSQAAPQAVYFLGEALIPLDMARWSAELFAQNLRDTRPEGRRFHQLSVARLFDLAFPRREPGFARKPGLSATPEVRARLTSIGVDVELKPPQGVIKQADADRLLRWAESFSRGDRLPELRYSYGRYLYLTGRHDAAVTELDSLSPLDIPMSRGGPDAKWRIRASYVAAAAQLAAGEFEDALGRFGRITKARPRDPVDRQVVELAWLAIARVYHDMGETADSVAAYRRIGRDSVFFPEAMYETAWTLLRAEEFDQAVQALDLLLIYEPDSPIVPEIKQLRGKIKIQQRDYRSAEEEFLVLRRDFDKLAKQLGRKLLAKGDATQYFAAVVGEDMEHFSLASILPVGALPVARSLPRALHAEDLARDVGYLERELAEVRDLLARMEEAIQAKEKARLFNDLGAHVASLDNVEDDLIEVQEGLVARLAKRTRGAGVDRLESQRRQLRNRVDRPLGAKTAKLNASVARIQKLHQVAHKLDLTVAAMRAELVATERYYEESRKNQKIDHQGFLTQAAALRDQIAAAEVEVAALRDRIRRAESAMRYHDPIREARRQVLTTYRTHLSNMYGALSRARKDPESDTLWKRVKALEDRGEKARASLHRAGAARLQSAVKILVEERANLDRYLVELQGVRGNTKALVADVMAAAYRDVVGELGNMVLRSEVGLLDVAWGMKEAETEEVQRLELERDRDLKELSRSVDMGLEELGQ